MPRRPHSCSYRAVGTWLRSMKTAGHFPRNDAVMLSTKGPWVCCQSLNRASHALCSYYSGHARRCSGRCYSVSRPNRHD